MMTLYVNHTTLNCRQVGYLAASTNEATWKLLILSMTLLHEDKLHTSALFGVTPRSVVASLLLAAALFRCLKLS
jgi:hypothetical protein